MLEGLTKDYVEEFDKKLFGGEERIRVASEAAWVLCGFLHEMSDVACEVREDRILSGLIERDARIVEAIIYKYGLYRNFSDDDSRTTLRKTLEKYRLDGVVYELPTEEE